MVVIVHDVGKGMISLDSTVQDSVNVCWGRTL
jgi:hypothetical protein